MLYDIIKYVACAFIIGILLIGIFSSCSSTRYYGNDTDAIITNQRAIQRLETATAELGRLHTSATVRVSNIRNEASRIGNGIDRLEYLFDQYDREVTKLLTEINRIRIQVSTESESNSMVANNTGN